MAENNQQLEEETVTGPKPLDPLKKVKSIREVEEPTFSTQALIPIPKVPGASYSDGSKKNVWYQGKLMPTQEFFQQLGNEQKRQRPGQQAPPTEGQTAPLVRRYGTEAEGIFSDLITPEKTAEQIREEKRGAVQGQINVIEKQAIEKAQRVEQEGAELVGQERAMASRAGLLTSPRGATQIGKAKTKVSEALGAVGTEKTAQITSILQRADERADEEIRFQQIRTDEGNRQYIDYLKDVQDEARADMQTMAQSDIPLENIKDDPAYQSLLRTTGYAEPIFDMMYEANRPEGGKEMISSEKLESGKLKILWKDARTGEITSQEYDWDLPMPTIIDNNPYLIERDEEGNVENYKLVPGLAGEIMTVAGKGVISMNVDGTFDVLIPELPNFQYSSVPGKGLYKIDQQGNASLIITEPERPADAFYTASDLLKIAKDMPFGTSQEIIDPNTKQPYTLNSTKEEDVVEPEKAPTPTSDIKEFEFAQNQGFEGDFFQFLKRKKEAETSPKSDLLSVSEAEKLGVPFGTKRSEAFGLEIEKPKPTEPNESKKVMFSKLSGVTDENGFITNNQWNQAKTAWLAEGLSEKDFLEQFHRFIYPPASDQYGKAETNFLLNKGLL